ncbi:MAG: DUF1003 domain-containing protein [Akkermansiaceae bacterium]|nr:DUF1003 domain-containing protein [Akkermansiaceae bacterium]
MPDAKEHRTCSVCGKDFQPSATFPLGAVRPKVLAEIQRELPGLDRHGYICRQDLARFRAAYVQNLLVSEKGELTGLEESVIESMREHDLMSPELRAETETASSPGERLADRVASFGGSWTFLLSFFGFLLLWIGCNSIVLLMRPFDPYPFIFLNLVLSCLAAVQAPVIMMSQNRQETKDRVRSEHDYQINLKAELEIRHLHEKMDHLLMQQWERLVEIQQVQIELLEELGERSKLRQSDEMP